MPPMGFIFAGLFGEFRPSDIRQKIIGNGIWAIAWTPAAKPSPAAFIISVSRKHFTTVYGRNSTRIRIPPGSNPIIEVLQLPIDSTSMAFFPSGYFATVENNAIKFEWDPPASVAADLIEFYRVYWDNGTGSIGFTPSEVFIEVQETGLASYEITTTELAAGTYKFVVRPVDINGNETANVATFTQVLTKFIDPVTAFALSYDGGTDKATLTWVDPSGIGAGDLEIYSNGGDATKPYPDYSTAIATVAAGVQTFLSGVLTEGLHVFGIRASDGTTREPNTSITARVLLDVTADEIAGFPPIPVLLAVPSAGGKVKLRAYVDPNVGAGLADSVEFYTNDGAGGPVDFTSAIGTRGLSQTGNVWFAEFESAVFGETARKFSAKSKTVGGVLSEAAIEDTVTPDSTIPAEAINIAISAVAT